MKLTTATRFGLPVIRIEGDVEFADAPSFERAAWEALTSRGAHIVLDLDKCTHLSSAGLAVLFSLVRWARSKQGLVMAVRPSAQILHLFRVVRLTGERGFSTFIDMESACQELDAPTGVPAS